MLDGKVREFDSSRDLFVLQIENFWLILSIVGLLIFVDLAPQKYFV